MSCIFQIPDDFVNSEICLSSVVRLGTSYLRLLCLLLQSVSDKQNTRSAELTFDQCIEWCGSCPEALQANVGAVTSDGRLTDTVPLLSKIFDSFSVRLHRTDNSVVASHILEILSVLATQGNMVHIERLVGLSWASLHTVYAHANGCFYYDSIPLSLHSALKRFRFGATSRELHTICQVLEKCVNAVSFCGRSEPCVLAHLRYGVLRHWGLLSATPVLLSSHFDHVSKLIAALNSLLQSVEEKIGSDDEEKKSVEITTCRKSKSTRPPSIIGLEAATFPDYFDLVVNVVIGVAAVLEPGLSDGRATGPYYYYCDTCSKFRRLIELYSNHFALFPQKSIYCVFNASRDMLSVSLSQLHRCVDWRNAQPLLSVTEREAGVYDAGSIKYLHHLLDAMASHVAGAILSLCDFWQIQDTHARLSKSTSLRFETEKAARVMRDVCVSHNLVSPSFDMQLLEPIEIDDLMTGTKGFHQMDVTSRNQSEKCHVGGIPMNSTFTPTPDGQQYRKRKRPEFKGAEEVLICEDIVAKSDDESSYSFVVAGGDWGDASDDDESVVLHSDGPLRRA